MRDRQSAPQRDCSGPSVLGNTDRPEKGSCLLPMTAWPPPAPRPAPRQVRYRPRQRRAAREPDRRRLQRRPISRLPQPGWPHPKTLSGARRPPLRHPARRAARRGPPMRREPSLCDRSREAAFGQQLIDQRTRLGDLGRQPSELSHCILLSLEYDTSTEEMHVQLITRDKPESGTDLSRDDETTLFTKNKRGIHGSIMPRILDDATAIRWPHARRGHGLHSGDVRPLLSARLSGSGARRTPDRDTTQLAWHRIPDQVRLRSGPR